MTEEKAGQTLQPTALVHEAYIRLVGGARPQDWDGRGHFFAAEGMRRILVESTRRKKAEKRGGGRVRADPDEDALAGTPQPLLRPSRGGSAGRASSAAMTASGRFVITSAAFVPQDCPR